MDIPYMTMMLKETMLENKELPSIIFVEHEDCSIHVLPVPGEEAGTDGKRIMFRCGQSFGLAHRWKPVTIAVVVHGWIVRAERVDYVRALVPEDASRKEVLAFAVMECSAPYTQRIYLTEILRDGSGELVDLLTLSKNGQGVQAMFLPAFLMGMRMAQKLTKVFFTEQELAEVDVFIQELHESE